MLIFFLGVAFLLCTVVVGGTRLVTGNTSTTNEREILGATIGLFSGGVVGEKTGFGRVMISIGNPDLPERDFVTSFGAIGDGILNAFFLASLRGILQVLLCDQRTSRQLKNPRLRILTGTLHSKSVK